MEEAPPIEDGVVVDAPVFITLAPVVQTLSLPILLLSCLPIFAPFTRLSVLASLC